MINQQLLDYIKQQLGQGMSEKEIKNILISNGWQEKDVEEAFSFVLNPVVASKSASASPPGASFAGVIDILKQAWSIYKQRLSVLLAVTVIPILMLAALIGIFIAIFISTGSITDIYSGSALAPNNTNSFFFIVVISLAILFFVIGFIVQTWGQLALLYAIKDNQEKIGVKEAYRRSWHKILSYWWVSFLIAFITAGGFLLLIVPGIIFTVWFSLAMFVLIAENIKGMDALLKSREYVRGKWGAVLWRLVFGGFFFLIISLIISFATDIIFGDSVISSIIGPIVGIFFTPLITTYLFLIYVNLKTIKGEIAFAPTRKQKLDFIIVGIVGILIVASVILAWNFFRPVDNIYTPALPF